MGEMVSIVKMNSFLEEQTPLYLQQELQYRTFQTKELLEKDDSYLLITELKDNIKKHLPDVLENVEGIKSINTETFREKMENLLLKTEKEENAINDFFIFFDQTFKIYEKKEKSEIKKTKVEIETKKLKDENNFSEEISISQNFSDNLKSIEETKKNKDNTEDFKEPDMEEIEKMENLGNVYGALNNYFKNTYKK